MFQMTVMWNFSSGSTQDYLYTLKYTKVEGGIVALPDNHALKVCGIEGKGLHVLDPGH